jgi:hypothetical protein
MPSPPVRRHHKQGLMQALARSLLGGTMALLTLLGLLTALPARAQGVELATLKTSRSEGALNLEFVARVTLPKTVEDALRSGVTIYFVAEAQLLRSRWYWRDERVNRVQRSWRVVYQPLTESWRVGLLGVNQTYPSLNEALSAASSSSGWRLAEPGQIEDGKNYTVAFSYRLDTNQLPGPMQLGLGGQGDWAVGISRVLKVPAGP